MADNPFQEHHCPTQQWIELHDSLAECLRRLPTTDWTPTIAPSGKQIDDTERKRIQKAIFDEYKSVVEPTSNAVVQIVTKGTWPPLPPKELYFLRLMLSAAILFVRRIVVGRGRQPVTIFPFPHAEVASVALWLLSEWWLEHGIHESYEAATTDEILFHAYFS